MHPQVIFTLARTRRSLPVAYFLTYREAMAYNAKFYDEAYVIEEQYLTRMSEAYERSE